MKTHEAETYDLGVMDTRLKIVTDLIHRPNAYVFQATTLPKLYTGTQRFYYRNPKFESLK